jgi:hypothetical protein
MNPVDGSHDVLHTAGWSVGDARITMPHGLVWLVTCTRGQHMVQTTAPTQAEAWQLAVDQAEALGMLGRNHPRNLGAGRG